jgi:hypothetical protein
VCGEDEKIKERGDLHTSAQWWHSPTSLHSSLKQEHLTWTRCTSSLPCSARHKPTHPSTSSFSLTSPKYSSSSTVLCLAYSSMTLTALSRMRLRDTRTYRARGGGGGGEGGQDAEVKRGKSEESSMRGMRGEDGRPSPPPGLSSSISPSLSLSLSALLTFCRCSLPTLSSRWSAPRPPLPPVSAAFSCCMWCSARPRPKAVQ